MLAVMETGKIFSLTVIKYDRKRKNDPRNGEEKEYLEACLFRREATEDIQVEGRLLTERERKIEDLRRLRHEALNKNPRHSKWYTRNIVLCAAGAQTSEIRKIHPPLVKFFDGKKVVP